MQTYGHLPVSFERGEGVWLWDDTGKSYLDALAGIAVCGLGHVHPQVTAALCEQASTLIHTSNLYHIPMQEQLAARLTPLAGMERAFFANSGAEANEAAIKLARLYGQGRGVKSPAIVVMEGSFHGRTLATLSATGNRKVQAGFEPLVQGFTRVPYNDLDAVAKVAANSNDIVAVLVEPVLGEGGVVIPDEAYLPGLRQLCDQQGWLLMLDEIQTGMCRTGQWFAWQHRQARPDVMTVAKALGNGFPIGACMAQGEAAHVLQKGTHGSTYGGNPLASHVALAVIAVLEDQGLAQRARTLGQRILAGLKLGLAGKDYVQEIRGQGLMIGIELQQPCVGLMAEALKEGLLISVTAGNVIRLLPPLILTDQEADEIVSRTINVVEKAYG